MGKKEIIQKKVDSFFDKKAVQYNKNCSDLRLIINYDNKLEYSLRDKEQVVENSNLKEILNLSLIEKMVMDEQMVEEKITTAIKSFEQENIKINHIQIGFFPKGRCCLFINKQYKQEININDIL